jgi:hypothetical protein
MDLAKTARNLAVADIALAFARDRVARMVPGMQPRRRRPPVGKLLIGGGLAAGLAALLFKRDAVRGLLPGGSSSEPAQPEPTGYTPPPVSNYDAPGPVANTATAVPVPPAFESPSIDEAAEEAAAAAEAANIGGSVSDYAGPELDEPAAPEDVPVVEAGGGEAEGQEQTEAELREAAEPYDGMSPAQAQIEEAADQAANPIAPETVEPVKPPDDSDEWRTWSGRTVQP